MPLADRRNQPGQGAHAHIDQPPQHQQQNRQGQQERVQNLATDFLGHFVAHVVTVGHGQPEVALVQREGAPAVAVMADMGKTDCGAGHKRRVRRAQPHLPLSVEQLEIQFAFVGMAERRGFVCACFRCGLPRVVQRRADGRIRLGLQLLEQERMQNMSRLRQSGIEQLFGFIARIVVADQAADGQRAAHDQQHPENHAAADRKRGEQGHAQRRSTI